MAFNSTTGLGVAAAILSTGNVNPLSNVSGKNGVILSLSGTSGTSGYPSTFQLKPVLADAAGNSVALGSALVLTAVAAATPVPYVLTASSAAVNGFTTVTGTITGGASNAFEGRLFSIAGFVNAGNNGIFECASSSATGLVLISTTGVAETHAGTAQDQTAVAVYTGTITGGGSNAFAGFDFVVAGFVGANNNGTFIATASSATTLTLTNPAATAETHAATATSEETTALTYVSYSPSAATVSATGLLTAVALGHSQVDVNYPAFNNGVGNVVSAGNPMNGLPINKVYGAINVKVVQ
jgi:hypothetical protein